MEDPRETLTAKLAEIDAEMTEMEQKPVDQGQISFGKRIADRKGAFDADALSDSVNTGTCNNTACFAPGLDQLTKVNPATRR